MVKAGLISEDYDEARFVDAERADAQEYFTSKPDLADRQLEETRRARALWKDHIR